MNAYLVVDKFENYLNIYKAPKLSQSINETQDISP